MHHVISLSPKLVGGNCSFALGHKFRNSGGPDVIVVEHEAKSNVPISDTEIEQGVDQAGDKIQHGMP